MFIMEYEKIFKHVSTSLPSSISKIENQISSMQTYAF